MFYQVINRVHGTRDEDIHEDVLKHKCSFCVVSLESDTCLARYADFENMNMTQEANSKGMVVALSVVDHSKQRARGRLGAVVAVVEVEVEVEEEEEEEDVVVDEDDDEEEEASRCCCRNATAAGVRLRMRAGRVMM